ncbi:MAG: chemotaxis protein CheW [Leptothrix ochracea]|uniref:chemotaxis protein CheW n=2 Tax=Leptothrix ochracea TaxID=735331 RepID=UPI0034E1C04C
MTQKEALMELQGRLTEKLQAVRSVSNTVGWLAVESAGRPFLLPLAESGEIFPVTTVVAVPHTQPWFMGVANLRGTLSGVVDLGGFLGLRTTRAQPGRDQAQVRMVAFNPGLEVNAALLIDRLAGLRNPVQLTLEPESETTDGGAHPAFASALYRDETGRVWQELRLALLARDERFLHILDRV